MKMPSDQERISYGGSTPYHSWNSQYNIGQSLTLVPEGSMSSAKYVVIEKYKDHHGRTSLEVYPEERLNK